MTTAILAGLITWLITTIVVESEITRPLRYWLLSQNNDVHLAMEFIRVARLYDAGERDAFVTHKPPRRNPLRWLAGKVSYLLSCHLCTGTWVGLVVAVFVTGPFDNVILDGLVYKGVAHLVLAVVTFLKQFPITVNVEAVESSGPSYNTVLQGDYLDDLRAPRRIGPVEPIVMGPVATGEGS